MKYWAPMLISLVLVGCSSQSVDPSSQKSPPPNVPVRILSPDISVLVGRNTDNQTVLLSSKDRDSKGQPRLPGAQVPTPLKPLTPVFSTTKGLVNQWAPDNGWSFSGYVKRSYGGRLKIGSIDSEIMYSEAEGVTCSPDFYTSEEMRKIANRGCERGTVIGIFFSKGF